MKFFPPDANQLAQKREVALANFRRNTNCPRVAEELPRLSDDEIAAMVMPRTQAVHELQATALPVCHNPKAGRP